MDYKIKELKRDLAPRDLEINNLKNETLDMDFSLKRFNKVNANLGYIVDDLRQRQEHMQELIKKNRSKIRSNEIFIKSFINAVYRCVQFIDDYDQLKKAVNDNLYCYVKDLEYKTAEIDPDIQKEYENQKRYLENSVNSLKKRLAKETQIHKQDNVSIMQENIGLIREINDLRKEVKKLRSRIRNTESVNGNQSQSRLESSKQSARRTDAGMDNEDEEAMTIEMQKKQELIEEMKRRAKEIGDENMIIRQNLEGGARMNI